MPHADDVRCPRLLHEKRRELAERWVEPWVVRAFGRVRLLLAIQDEQGQRLAGLLCVRDGALELDVVALPIPNAREDVRHRALRLGESTSARDRRHGVLCEGFESADVIRTENTCIRRIRGNCPRLDTRLDDRHDERGRKRVALGFVARPVRPVDRDGAKRPGRIRKRRVEAARSIVRPERSHHGRASRSLDMHRCGLGTGPCRRLDRDPPEQIAELDRELQVVDASGPCGRGSLDDALEALGDRAHVEIELLEHRLEALVGARAPMARDDEQRDERQRQAGGNYRSHDR